MLATAVARFCPGHVKAVSIAYEVHQLLSVPLTLLVAFRFQGSYDRWWSSRKEIEMVATNTIDIAMMCANNVDVLDTKHLERTGERRWVKNEACVDNELRMLGLLDALCFFVEEQVMRGVAPHPLNEPKEWKPGLAQLSAEDAARCVAAPDRVLWCMDELVGTIHTAQKLGVLTSELASTMYEKACSIHENVRQCDMVVAQLTPASFVVHMRSFLFLFCFTFPFTVMHLNPTAIVPKSAVVAFSLLGIEFSSREMEHPFGEDESDVPCRKILQQARTNIQILREGHNAKSPSRLRSEEG